MRIAIPIDRLKPGRGGLERYVADLSRSLALRGHEVSIPCIEGLSPADGVEVHHLAVARGRGALRRFSVACEAWLEDSGIDVSLGVGRTIGSDIVQAHGSLHGASRSALRKAESTVVGTGLRQLGDALRWKDRFLLDFERGIYRHPSTRLFVALSKRSRGEILAAFPEIGPRLKVIPGAVAVERFRRGDRGPYREEVRRRWEIPEESPVALFVAHHFRLKGLGPCLEAIARIPEGRAPTLVVIGAGRPGAFRRQATRLGIGSRVIFAGPEAKMEPVFLGSDLLIHPTFHDPCSLATLEAWAAGIPVVTTSLNGAAELVGAPGDGPSPAAVVDGPWDIDGLAAGIEEMLTPEKWRKRSEAAVRLAETRSLERHTDEMEALLREASAWGARCGATARS